MSLLAVVSAGCSSESSTPWKLSPQSPSQKPTEATKDEATNDQPKSAAVPKTTILVPKPAAIEPKQPPGLADFQLTERSGRKVTKKDLLGKPAVICFVFTQCAGPCGNVSSQMRKLQEWTKSQQVDVRLVTVTVDPERDTPAVLREYAKNFGADKDRWWFLTGPKLQVYRFVQSSLGQKIEELAGVQKGFEIDHSLAAVLLDAKGKIVDEYLIEKPLALGKLQSRLARWKREGTFKP